VTSAKAIIDGIAPDGGLYIPERLPALTYHMIRDMRELDYVSVASHIIGMFLKDYTPGEIYEACAQAYTHDRFTHPDIAPIQQLGRDIICLELWHGPTAAFKDMALQLLPRLMTLAQTKQPGKKEVAILVATSGDTGKAAMAGFQDVKGSRVIVFYPDGGVSEVQRLQMVTQKGDNVFPIAVKGNFDDTQNGVKRLFLDTDFTEEVEGNGFSLTSANSINWGRLVPQIVYYFYAYNRLQLSGSIREHETVNVAVPTGNFGNILAAYYAKKMGLPLGRLICASNENDVLTEFIRTGVYSVRRPFYKTRSPSMDILISSNLERLLFELLGREGDEVSRKMVDLAEDRKFTLQGESLRKLQEDFWGGSASDEDTTGAIAHVFTYDGYMMDPHTAVGYDVYHQYRTATGDEGKVILVSTASPYKFNGAVAEAIGGHDAIQGSGEFALVDYLHERSGWPVHPSLEDLEHQPILHKRICQPEDMADMVRDCLGISHD
jgi:threonine synthase